MSQASYSNPITWGYVGATAVTSSGNAGALELDSKVTVVLSSSYNRSLPAGYESGYPDPNPGSPPATSLTATPQVIPSGKTVTLFAGEGNALIALGAASLV
jgi:hypothetical protein